MFILFNVVKKSGEKREDISRNLQIDVDDKGEAQKNSFQLYLRQGKSNVEQIYLRMNGVKFERVVILEQKQAFLVYPA